MSGRIFPILKDYQKFISGFIQNQRVYPIPKIEINLSKQLRTEFPGIKDENINLILTDKDPQRIAEVKVT